MLAILMTIQRNSIGYGGRCARAGEISNGTAVPRRLLNSWRASLLLFDLKLGPTASLLLDAAPLLFTSPVSTPLPNVLSDEDEEVDESTLGRPEPEPEAEPA